MVHTCEVVIHIFFSTNATFSSSVTKFFVFIKKPTHIITWYFGSFILILFASCVFFTHSVLNGFFCCIFISLQTTFSFEFNAWISFLLLLDDVFISLASNVYVWMGFCVPVRKTHKNAGGSSRFHFLLFSYLMSGIYM